MVTQYTISQSNKGSSNERGSNITGEFHGKPGPVVGNDIAELDSLVAMGIMES